MRSSHSLDRFGTPFDGTQLVADAGLSKTVVAAIVLAGGHGTRFGQPKYSVTLRGRRIVDVVVVLPAGHSWDGDPGDRFDPAGVIEPG